MFLGLPNHYSALTDLSFYSSYDALYAEATADLARDAIKACSREKYDNARKILEGVIADDAKAGARMTLAVSQGSPLPDPQRRLGQINHDIAQLKKALEKFPPFPEDCKDKRTGALMGQPVTPKGDGPVFIGIPENYVASADLSFFANGMAWSLEAIYLGAEQAIRECDRAKFEGLKNALAHMIASAEQDFARSAAEAARAKFPDLGSLEVVLRQQRHDIAQLHRAYEKLGKFEDRCPKEKKVGALMDVFIQGGAALAFQSNGFFRALDTFSDETPTVFGGGTRSTGVFGGGARLNVLKVNPTFFVEARFQTAFGATSFQQTAGLSGLGAPGQAPFGESLVRENWGIPLLLGSTWSLGNVGTLGELGLDLYGGITIANWTQSLAGGEAGVPGTPAYSVQQTRTSVDPTFGVGLRLPVIDFNGDGRADVILGVYGELAFRQGSSVTTISPSSSGLNYTGWVDGRTNVALMLRLSVPLGGGPLFRVD